MDDILKSLKRLSCASFIATRSSHERAFSAEKLGRMAKAYFSNVYIKPSLASALSLAEKTSRERSSLTLITGSLFLVGEALERFKKKV